MIQNTHRQPTVNAELAHRELSKTIDDLKIRLGLHQTMQATTPTQIRKKRARIMELGDAIEVYERFLN